MELNPAIFTAKVMHKRNFPKVNQFTYSIYYLWLPLSLIKSDVVKSVLAVNRPSFLSFYEKDHGEKNNDKIENWIRGILTSNKIEGISQIILVTMPRIFGYVFNPVSFWLCVDKENNLKAVLCEVNNTFGETHSYLCTNEDNKNINKDDVFFSDKLFHVSPFLERKGKYSFRFAIEKKSLAIWIDFYDKDNSKQLNTSVIGKLEPLSKKNLIKVFFKYPLVTFKTIFLIHWQALKLISKGIKYIAKPKQFDNKLSKNI